MEFIKADLDKVSYTELLEIMDANKLTMKKKLDEMSKMTTSFEEKYEILPHITSEMPKKDSHQTTKDDAFEDEVSNYLKNLNKITTKEALSEKIDKILPAKDNYNYERIIYRLQLELIKNINDIEAFIKSESLSQEEIVLFEEEKELAKEKLLYLRNILIPNAEKDLPVENTLIFIPTISGNIRVINELEKIPSEFYPAFLELILSIKKGTFKNAKRFLNNNNINGILEVKGFQVRVIYERLAKNTYAVISAFIKKTTNDNGYRSSIDQKVSDYFAVKDAIKALIDNPEFIEENKLYEQEVFNILSSSKEKAKEKVNKND